MHEGNCMWGMNCSEFKERSLHCVKVISYSQMFNSRSKKIPVLVIFAVLISLLVFPAEAIGIPQVVCASVVEQTSHLSQTTVSLTFPQGNPLYIYGFGTGGGAPSNGFTNGQYASVTNNFAGKNIVAALAACNTYSNSFTTETEYQVIGGVAVSSYSSYTESNATNSSVGASFVSDTFTVTTPNSLVVVVAIAGDGQNIILGGNSSVQTYATQQSPIAMTIANTTLGPGAYYVTETTQPVAGQENRAGDIIGVWVFKPILVIVTPQPTLIFNWHCFPICLGSPNKLCFTWCWPW